MSCAFRSCKNYSAKIKKEEGITYHAFPRNEIALAKWTRIVKEERCEKNWMPSIKSRICSVHFKEEDIYKTSKGFTRLKKSAMPAVISDDVPQPGTPTSLDDVNISDMDFIFDSPLEAALKIRVHKLATDKKILQRNNKLLKMQNKRLKERLTNMKNLFIILKKKKFLSKEQIIEFNLKVRRNPKEKNTEQAVENNN